MTVYIIGAGPGAADLITIRGARLVERCELVLYTGSLVPVEVIERAGPHATVLDSAGMTLETIVGHMAAAHDRGQDVARVHTGDPSLFGSTAEQMRHLQGLGIPYEIVPGVSSFTAAAAAIGRELTLPEHTQTVIVTRCEGRTPMPPGEQLTDLARHGATLALFLSATLVKRVVRDLTPAYGGDCPVAVVQRASWPDQRVIRCTLDELASRMREAGITATAMILVGRALSAEDFPDSRLYAADFTHGFRRADAPDRDESAT